MPAKKKLKEEMPTKEYLAREETSLIEDATQHLRDKLLIRLLRRLACRVSEVLGIEERHIDFAHRMIRIEHEKERLNLTCPSCGARLAKSDKYCSQCTSPVVGAISKVTMIPRLRKIPVDQDTLQLIRQYIKHGEVTEVNGKRMLFTISRQRAWQIVKETAERAGFFELLNPTNDRRHHVSPHKFRDAYGTNYMKEFPTLDDARILQEILGHQNIGTTLKYRKVSGTEVQKRYDDLIKREEHGN